MNASLRLKRDNIALEALAGAGIQEVLSNTFPGMIEHIKGFVSHFLPSAPGIPLPARQVDFLRELTKHAYLDISPLTAHTPEGFDGNFLKYSNDLLLASVHVAKILSGTLSAYTVFLSQLISNNDQKFNTHSFDRAYKELATEREKLIDAMSTSFKKGSTVATSTIGDVTNRNAEWEHILQNVYNISKTINMVDRKVLDKKISECAELLDVIKKKLDAGFFEGGSKEVAMNLSNGAYQIASEIEFFAIVYYKILSFTESVNKTTEHFMGVMKNNR